jgi:hypothetical protein
MRDPSVTDPWQLPVDGFTRATITLETEGGEVATIVCEPEQLAGRPYGMVGVRIGREPVTARQFASVRDAVVVGGPLVEVTAGLVTVRRGGSVPPG